MFCDKCGTQIDDDDAFCPECGNRVIPVARASVPRTTGYVNMSSRYAQGQPAAAPYAQTQPVRRKKKSAAPLIIGGIALVAVIAFAATLLFSKPYLKPIDNFIKAVNTDDYSLLYESVYDSRYMEEYEEIVADSSNMSYTVTSTSHLTKSDLKDYSDSGYNFKDGYVLEVNLRYYSDSWGSWQYSDIMIFVMKENGKWKILGMD